MAIRVHDDMMKSVIQHASLLILSLVATGSAMAAEITVFAAASLTDALKEIGTAYEKSTGEKVRFNFAGSNTLARQIEAGEQADLFFSADKTKMDDLQSAGLLAVETRKNLLGNSLVVIVSNDGPGIAKQEDLASNAVTRVSIADPEEDPAGVYAKAWLKKVNLWEKLQPKIVPAVDARAATAVVEAGNAEVGIVYKTDASISDKVEVAYDVPSDEVPEIVYPAAVLKDTRNKEATLKFLTHLESADADAVFRRFGFSLKD